MKNLHTAMERFRKARESHENEPIILPPALYEELRQLCDIQPVRVKDSRGAHLEKA